MRLSALSLVALLALSHARAAPAASLAKTAAPAAAEVSLDELLGRFRRAPGLFARFTEEKHLAMLDSPIVTRGTIHFVPPRRLARRAQSPIASTLIIDGDKLQMGDSSGKQELDLGTNPVARMFVDSFVKLLAGDKAGLERIFKIQLSPRPKDGWQMVLVPRLPPMDKLIKDLTVRGEGLMVRELDVRESNGDWTQTTFTEVDVNRRYTPAELGQIFRMPSQ